jgi:hypothetical protein
MDYLPVLFVEGLQLVGRFSLFLLFLRPTESFCGKNQNIILDPVSKVKIEEP